MKKVFSTGSWHLSFRLRILIPQICDIDAENFSNQWKNSVENGLERYFPRLPGCICRLLGRLTAAPTPFEQTHEQ